MRDINDDEEFDCMNMGVFFPVLCEVRGWVECRMGGL